MRVLTVQAVYSTREQAKAVGCVEETEADRQEKKVQTHTGTVRHDRQTFR